MQNRMTPEEKKRALKELLESSKQTQSAIEKQLAKLDKKKTIWNVEEGDEICLLMSSGGVLNTIWDTGDSYINQRSQGNIVLRKDHHKLEAKARVRWAITKIERFIEENGLEFEPDWDDKDQDKYILYFRNCNWRIDNLHGYDLSPFFFSCEADAQLVIDNCQEELEVVRKKGYISNQA